MQNKSTAEPRCARCGAAFACGMQAGEERCWCNDLPLLQPVAGRGCICRACLEDELKSAAPG